MPVNAIILDSTFWTVTLTDILNKNKHQLGTQNEIRSLYEPERTTFILYCIVFFEWPTFLPNFEDTRINLTNYRGRGHFFFLVRQNWHIESSNYSLFTEELKALMIDSQILQQEAWSKHEDEHTDFIYIKINQLCQPKLNNFFLIKMEQ